MCCWISYTLLCQFISFQAKQLKHFPTYVAAIRSVCVCEDSIRSQHAALRAPLLFNQMFLLLHVLMWLYYQFSSWGTLYMLMCPSEDTSWSESELSVNVSLSPSVRMAFRRGRFYSQYYCTGHDSVGGQSVQAIQTLRWKCLVVLKRYRTSSSTRSNAILCLWSFTDVLPGSWVACCILSCPLWSTCLVENRWVCQFELLFQLSTSDCSVDEMWQGSGTNWLTVNSPCNVTWGTGWSLLLSCGIRGMWCFMRKWTSPSLTWVNLL